MQFDDYKKILMTYNLIGGAGKLPIGSIKTTPVFKVRMGNLSVYFYLIKLITSQKCVTKCVSLQALCGLFRATKKRVYALCDELLLAHPQGLAFCDITRAKRLLIFI